MLAIGSKIVNVAVQASSVGGEVSIARYLCAPCLDLSRARQPFLQRAIPLVEAVAPIADKPATVHPVARLPLVFSFSRLLRLVQFHKQLALTLGRVVHVPVIAGHRC